MKKCNGKTEVYSRVVGFFRPVQDWNRGKKAEFEDRKEYDFNNEVKNEK
jgi:ribonucleoside-triphosphate reductase